MATITFLHYIPILFLLWLLPIVLHYLFRKPSKPTTGRLNLPPSPPELPIIGSLHRLSTVAYIGFKNLKKYGSILYVRLATYPVIVVNSASLAVEVFKTQDLNFSWRTRSPFGDVVLFGSESSFFNSPYGDYWKFMKKLSVTELLGAAQIKRSYKVRREELDRFLHKMLEKSEKGEVVDLSGEILTLTNNSTCRMLMSTRVSGEDNEAERCRVLVNDSFQLASKLAIAYVFGPFKNCIIWFFRKQLEEIPRGYDELFEKLLREHEERAKVHGYDREDKDLMDILLKVYHSEDAEFKITRTQMKTYFLDLFTGGTGTTTDGILWVMANLINRPSVFNKVREEIESVVGKNRLVEESDVPNLHYLQAVVKETFRLYPPVPVFDRVPHQSCKLGGYDVPKGMTVVLDVHTIMRDPEAWDNPDEFIPERFMDIPPNKEHDNNLKQTIAQNLNQNFIPFGGGRRMCPGQNLTSSLTHSSVAAMVQCFDWKSCGGGGKVDMQPRTGITLGLAQPLTCVPTLHFNPFDV
ncbi:hypothetical protein Tsubulata_040514 [Turnera subulata]|uniref:Cytochrome P450 n=1 Tax=Turnera subulata TaxID=218843 RepID=A0A9Q0FJQ9_9ROSI|nr:hypothetical protein Tsubulata_040514 [Turnera subulata]